jgi:enamine deaminase RidA (YjgF/YER057c/UK114 family)
MRSITPELIRPPFARYPHGVEVRAGARLLFASGQLGARPDDAVPEGAEAQARQCLANIDAILAEAGMTRANVVRLNAFVVAREDMPAYGRARDAWAEGLPFPPASTLVIVSGFTRPEFRVEVEATAAAE